MAVVESWASRRIEGGGRKRCGGEAEGIRATGGWRKHFWGSACGTDWVFGVDQGHVRNRAMAECGEKGVIRNDEKERGKGASLLDPPLDGNVAGRGTPKERGHFNMVEAATDETLKPARESCFLEDFEDPRASRKKANLSATPP